MSAHALQAERADCVVKHSTPPRRVCALWAGLDAFADLTRRCGAATMTMF